MKSTLLTAAILMLATSPVLADHSRNPSSQIFTEHLPAWLRGDNQTAGGPANELIPESGLRSYPPARYTATGRGPAIIAPDLEARLLDDASSAAPEVVELGPANNPHARVQR